MTNKLLTAIPLFLAAVLGVFFQYAGWNPVLCVLIALLFIVGGTLARSNARGRLAKDPVSAVWVWQGWGLALIGAIALFAYLLSSLGTALPDLIEGSGLFDLSVETEGKTKAEIAKAKDALIAAIAAALSLAVTTLLGALFLTDLKGAKGGWWPPAQIKKAMAATFSDKVDALKQHASAPGLPDAERISRIRAFELLKRAVHEDSVSEDHPTGWSYPAAKARAVIIADALKD